MKNNIRIMYMIAFLQGLVFYAPIATLYRTSVGLSLFDISLIESVSYILMIVFEIPWGILADRIGYRKTMIVCSFLYFLSKIIFWQADNFVMFLLERIILSIVFSGLSGVDTSILYLSAGKEASQKVFSISGTLSTIGMIMASLGCAVIVKDNFRLAGLLTVLPYAFSFGLSLFLKEVKAHDEERQTFHHIIQVLKETVQNKRFLLLAISVGIMSETTGMVTIFLNQPKYTSVGMDASTISFVYIVMTLLGLIEAYSATMAKQIGQKRMGIFLYLMTIFAAVLLAFTTQAFFSVLAIGIVNITYSLFQPLFQTCQHDCVSSSERVTAISAGALVADFAAVFIDLVLGRLADISLLMSFLAAGVFFTIALVLFTVSVK